MLVDADLLLEPDRVAQPLGQRVLLELSQRDSARQSDERPFGDELDLLQSTIRQPGGQWRSCFVRGCNAVQVPTEAVSAERGGGRDQSDPCFAGVVGKPAASSSLLNRCSSSPWPFPFERKASPSHQSMPISRALSADAISRRIFTVRSSMSSRLIWMSPAITIPLSRTRSSTSASCAGWPDR